MRQAAVVGGGTMGNGIAHVFALHGWSVTLIDAAPAALEKALTTIRSNLERQAKKGTIAPGAVAETLSRIRTAGDVQGAAGASIADSARMETACISKTEHTPCSHERGTAPTDRHKRPGH